MLVGVNVVMVLGRCVVNVVMVLCRCVVNVVMVLWHLLRQKDCLRTGLAKSIAGLEPVIVDYLTACVLDRIVLQRVRVLRMLRISAGDFTRKWKESSEINSEKCTKCTLLLPRQTPHTPLLFVCRQIVCWFFYVATNRKWL